MPQTAEEVLAGIMGRLARTPAAAAPEVASTEDAATGAALPPGIGTVSNAPLVRCADCRNVRYHSRRQFTRHDGGQWKEWLECRQGHEVTLRELNEQHRYCVKFAPRRGPKV